tara:strand:- start:2488 stop:3390 length:903 start_codon:yes stop_codon:yes gene_type:complete
LNQVGVVSHDAGGAEIISNWVKENPNKYSYNFFLEGPAVSIFKKNISKDLIIFNDMDSFLNKSDFLVCGTSWQSSLEKRFVCEANLRKKKVVSILDHWINYRERFSYNNKINLPSEIWVCDSYALEIAKQTFTNLKIKLITNPYIKSIEDRIAKNKKTLDQNVSTQILYVCEPIREHAKLQHGNENFYGYTEESALEYFLENVNTMKLNFDSIHIRPHPSELQDKYNWALSNFKNFNITIGSQNDLIDDVLSSEIVVGCESMAMAVALVARKRVYTSIPPDGRECVLPHNEIKKIHENRS